MRPLPSLHVGVMPAAARGRVVRALRETSRAHAGLVVTASETWGTSTDVDAVREGALDALVLVGPAAPAGLRADVVGHVDRHVVVAEDHALAREHVVRLEHLLDLPTFRRPDDRQPGWRSYWLHDDARGHEARYLGRSTTELDALVAIGTGRVIGTAPQGWGRLPGLRTRPVVDLSPAPVVLLTRPEKDADPLAHFVQTLQSTASISPTAALSPAERRVATLVADGLSNTQIAQTLSLSPRTVECHVANARHKLGLRSRSHLASLTALHDMP